MYLSQGFHLASFRSCLPSNYETLIRIQEYNTPWQNPTANDKLNIVVLPNHAFFYDPEIQFFKPSNYLYRYADHIDKTYGAVGFVVFVPAAIASTIPFLAEYAKRVSDMDDYVFNDKEQQQQQQQQQPSSKPIHGKGMSGIMTTSLSENLKKYKNGKSYPSMSDTKAAIPLLHFAKSPSKHISSHNLWSSTGRYFLSVDRMAEMINERITPFRHLTYDAIKTIFPSLNVLNAFDEKFFTTFPLFTVEDNCPAVQTYVLAHELAPFCNPKDCSGVFTCAFLTRVQRLYEWPVSILPVLQVMIEHGCSVQECVRIQWAYSVFQTPNMQEWLFARDVQEWLFAQDGFEAFVLSWLKDHTHAYKKDKSSEEDYISLYDYKICQIGLQFPAFVAQLIEQLDAGRVKNTQIIKSLPFESVIKKTNAKHYDVETLVLFLSNWHRDIRQVLEWAFEHPGLAEYINQNMTRRRFDVHKNEKKCVYPLLIGWGLHLDNVKLLVEKGVDPVKLLNLCVDKEDICNYLLKLQPAYACLSSPPSC